MKGSLFYLLVGVFVATPAIVCTALALTWGAKQGNSVKPGFAGSRQCRGCFSLGSFGPILPALSYKIPTSDPVEMHPRHLDVGMQVCLPVYSLPTIKPWCFKQLGMESYPSKEVVSVALGLALFHPRFKKILTITWGSGNFLAMVRKDTSLIAPLCCESSLATWNELLPCFKDALGWPALSPAPAEAAQGPALAIQGCRQSVVKWPFACS